MEPLELPTVIASRYRLLDEIGRGNIGRVFRAEHLHTGEGVAIKMLASHAADPTLIERFKREARTPALIRSDHVVKVTDADVAPELDGAPFLVMELLDGLDLEGYLAEKGRLSSEETLVILGQVARALDKAHAMGVVHRDLKPANIFLHRGERGTVVKVLDFGISKIASASGAADLVITASGTVMGTPLYMPPEQALGRAEIGPPADVWALGMITFRLLTGHAYWTLGTMAELMAAIVRDPLSAPTARQPELPAAFDEWFLRSCHRDPGSRFRTAGEQITALAASLGVVAPEMVTLPRADATQRSAKPKEPLAARATVAEGRPTRSAEGERRQVTVLSCEMTLSPLGIEEVDPEDLREISREYHEECTKVWGALGGSIAQTMGDGVLVYFGYPRAFGDDARRAVTAGLRIQRAAEAIDRRVRDEMRMSLALRVGVHTGLVVTGDATGDPRAIVGQAPQVASRLRRSAPANGVVVSQATHRLVRAYFSFETLGARTIEGTVQEVELLKVTGEIDSAEDSVGAAGAPLVGRDSEIGLLCNRWEEARSGGCVVAITGEPGIGKSRLLRALREKLTGERWLECRGSPYFENTSFHPVIELIGRLAGFGARDPISDRALKLRQLVRDGGAQLAHDTLPLLSALLSLPAPPGAAPLNLSPQRQKQRTHEAILGLFLALASKQPFVLAVEDLHWVDPSTMELLSLLVDQGPTTGILALVTARPEMQIPWLGRSHVTPIHVTRLTRARAVALIEQLTEGKSFPRDMVEQLAARSDGVPLFVEELTRSVMEEPAAARTIPATLRDSLTGRLDRLGDSKATVQLAATLGREFEYELLCAVSPLDGEALERDLRRLVDAELLYQKGPMPRARFTFKHALLQDAAYESLLKNARRDAHKRIARVLGERFLEVAETQPEILARHHAAAGSPAEAATYLLRAGQNALQRSANVEAIRHWEQALDLARSLPPGDERSRLEAILHTMLGVPLMMTRGYGAPEVEKTYARALELKQIGEPQERLPVLWGLWIFHHVRGRYRTAHELSGQLLLIAERSHDAGIRLVAHLARGCTTVLLGEIETADWHLSRALGLYDPVGHREQAHVYGQDPGMFCCAMRSWNLWLQGRPDDALATARQGIEFAEAALHPNTLGFALGMAAALHQYRGDVAATLRLSQDLIALCTEQGLLHWVALGRMLHGWAARDMAEMLEGREVWEQVGARVANTFWDCMIAEAHGEAGAPDLGLEVLARARAFAAESEERAYAEELDRVEGELLWLATKDDAAARGRFERALASAGKRGARSLELRAATSLSRLLVARGDAEAPARLLAPLLAGFTQGQGTRDRERAEALLQGKG